ncbi:SLBB domain-containing protein [candidate division KSB1 bacterium]|nr:SLBB domain-containing protein [candidate division KSB1 bacterium]
MRQFLIVVASVVLFIVSLPPASAQIPEEKKTDTDRTNPFLNSESSEQLDLLQRYYQRIFSQQGKSSLSRLGTESQNDPARFFSQAQAIGMEGPINPAEYVVGPFDLLTIIVWGIAPFNYTGPVTPEGALLIPTVGELAVAGNTLAEAKEQIRQAVRKKYTAGDISVNLVSLRTFKVTVAGAVANPGAYTVSPVDRVDRVVYLANLAATPQAPPVDQNRESSMVTFRTPETKPAPAISLRNIKLYRGHRDTVDVDLVRYYAGGETRFNPYLRDGDVVFVPAENLAGNRVSIYGGVRMPGAFEFHPGDSLQTLLKIAQGPTALADLEKVEVARFLPDGRQVQILTVNLLSGQNGHSPDMALQPNDRVFIRENPELRKERTVSVKGAVSRPGEYAIVHGQTMLSDIIGQAGGFTPEASIAEAKLIRNYDNPDELQSNPDYARLVDIRLTDLKPEDRQYFNYETAIKRGFVAVDFLKLFNHHNEAADVPLRDGDEIYVPLLRHTVNVFGQVINPGYVTYVEGMDHRYYLERAGGLSKEADRGKVRILKRDTKAWMEPGDTKIEPGDEIFVSRKARRPASVFLSATRDILQTATGLATVVLLIIQVQK